MQWSAQTWGRKPEVSFCLGTQIFNLLQFQRKIVFINFLGCQSQKWSRISRKVRHSMNILGVGSTDLGTSLKWAPVYCSNNQRVISFEQIGIFKISKLHWTVHSLHVIYMRSKHLYAYCTYFSTFKRLGIFETSKLHWLVR